MFSRSEIPKKIYILRRTIPTQEHIYDNTLNKKCVHVSQFRSNVIMFESFLGRLEVINLLNIFF